MQELRENEEWIITQTILSFQGQMPNISYCSESQVTLGSRNSKISWGSLPQMRAITHEGDGDCPVAQKQSSPKDQIALLKQAMAGIIILQTTL